MRTIKTEVEALISLTRSLSTSATTDTITRCVELAFGGGLAALEFHRDTALGDYRSSVIRTPNT